MNELCTRVSSKSMTMHFLSAASGRISGSSAFPLDAGESGAEDAPADLEPGPPPPPPPPPPSLQSPEGDPLPPGPEPSLVLWRELFLPKQQMNAQRKFRRERFLDSGKK